MMVNDINVEDIMEEIRREIIEKGYTNDQLSFSDYNEVKKNSQTIDGCLEILSSSCYVQPHKMLPPEKGISGRLKRFIKRVIRKLVKFYVEPIVFEQNEFNSNTVMLMNLFHEYIHKNNKKIETMEAEIERLTNKCLEANILD